MSHSPKAGSPLTTADQRRPRRLTRTGMVVAAVMLAASTLASTAPPAHAEDPLPSLTCNINFQLNFSPPLTLTNTTADATVSAGFVNCISPNGEHDDLLSGAVTGSGTAESLAGVPCSLLLTVEGTADLTWNTGATSEIEFLANTNPLNGLVTLNGEVTGGELEGTTGLAVPVLANPNLDCLFGLTNLTSALTQVVFL